MRLINLNIWGGILFDELIQFLREKKQDSNFFCLQEVHKSDRSVITPKGGRSNILLDLKKELSDFDFIFSPSYHGRDFEYVVDYPLSHGPAIFWKKSHPPKKTGSIFTHYSENDVRQFPGHIQPDVPRNFQYLIYDKFLVINFHGYWTPSAKFDTKERLEQSEKIIAFAKNQNLPAIIAGDFNLAIDTKSVAMFEEGGFRNLVRESKAKATRSKHYNIKWRKNDKFADYIFVSKDVRVLEFKVLPDQVSDHLPLYLEFEV
ncbi:MAG: endonuclease/exonuclease/phosphatase family protein [Candidatus Levybacteria bacterium]|nr:endonuclease/exonuclease/phosphatase family protein [Candidatus Levybacteria bacterium]